MAVRKIELRQRGSTDFATDDIVLYPVTDWAYVLNKPTTYTPSSHSNTSHSTDYLAATKAAIEALLTGVLTSHSHTLPAASATVRGGAKISQTGGVMTIDVT